MGRALRYNATTFFHFYHSLFPYHQSLNSSFFDFNLMTEQILREISGLCTLTSDELLFLTSTLNEYALWLADDIYHDVYDETGSEERARAARNGFLAEIEELTLKLERGECPGRREKVTIREALAAVCPKEKKDFVRRMFPKLKMRWTSNDETWICEMERS